MAAGAVPALASAVALGACGAPPRLDVTVLERILPGQLVGDHPEVVEAVQCPRPIAQEVGLVVQCTATIGGTPVVVTVTQLDDHGAVRAELDRRLFDVTSSAATLAARLTKDLGVATTVECAGPAVRVFTVGETLTCTARDPSLRSRTLAVMILDEAGTLDAKLA